MHWYAVRTAPHRERTTSEKLKAEGLTTFYPRNRCRVVRRHRTHWTELPHFPTYVFAQAELTSLSLIRKAGGQVVMFDGKPTAIPDEVMTILMAGADETGLIKMPAHDLARKRFKVMQRLVFTSGPFANTLARVIEDAGGDTLRVLMNFLGAQRETTVSVHQVSAA